MKRLVTALAGAGVTGFPSDLWSRQRTDIRSTDRPAYMDVHATAQYDRVMKEGGTDEITTIYMGDGPPEKYRPPAGSTRRTGGPGNRGPTST